MLNAAMVRRLLIAAGSRRAGRKKLLWAIALIFSPLLIALILLLALLSGTGNHNAAMVDYAFYGGRLSGALPPDMLNQLSALRVDLASLEAALETFENIESAPDLVQIKAYYYTLFMQGGPLMAVDKRAFVACFLDEDEKVVTKKDDAGNEYTESITVYAVLDDVFAIESNLVALIGSALTPDVRAQSADIYAHIKYGKDLVYTLHAGGLDDVTLSDAPFVGEDGFVSPLGAAWRQLVTSEFGKRVHPISGKVRLHGGIDLASPAGTPIRAALDGSVVISNTHHDSYGKYIMLDHGGKVATLYAHCSKLLVAEGDSIQAGDIIAEVGTTGSSTGNHLHFEIRVNGVAQNPRRYLP